MCWTSLIVRLKKISLSLISSFQLKKKEGKRVVIIFLLNSVLLFLFFVFAFKFYFLLHILLLLLFWLGNDGMIPSHIGL